MIKDSIYFKRYATQPPLFPKYHLNDQVEIIVVIPAYKEEDLIHAVVSLLQNKYEGFEIGIIVVINAPENASGQVKLMNAVSERSMLDLGDSRIMVASVTLPEKKAGVGLARKIGMDEAARWFNEANKDGIIACFDADCTCSTNYLQEIWNFYSTGQMNAGVVFFEHPLIENGIIQYESFLRYHINALRYVGFPYATQTLGSCITVKSSIYQKQGGMNTRKAGEDFYFLIKIVPLGGFGEINQATINPAARISDRVPFGTGHALGKLHEVEQYRVYDFRTYEDLKILFNQLDLIYQSHSMDEIALPDSIAPFLKLNEFDVILANLLANSRDLPGFIRKFFTWFDAFRILKFLHHSRDLFYPNIALKPALSWLNKRVIHEEGFDDFSVENQLLALRMFDRSNPVTIPMPGQKGS